LTPPSAGMSTTLEAVTAIADGQRSHGFDAPGRSYA
jgi:hypothetical protein